MAIRKHKPTTPGRRGSSVADFVEITRTTPVSSAGKTGRARRNAMAKDGDLGRLPRRLPLSFHAHETRAF